MPCSIMCEDGAERELSCEGCLIQEACGETITDTMVAGLFCQLTMSLVAVRLLQQCSNVGCMHGTWLYCRCLICY